MSERKHRRTAKVERRGVGSVDIAMQVLTAVGASNGAQTLKAISELCDMPASKVHRYLASFVRTGFVRQDLESRNYELASASLHLGLAALMQLDIVRLATQAIVPLSETTGLTSLVAVWSERGPIVIRMQRGRRHVVTSLGLGSVLLPMTSATGRVFLAFSNSAATSRAVSEQRRSLTRASAAHPSVAELEKILERVRRERFASVDGTYIPGLSAVSAPVLDAQGEAALAITLMSAGEPIVDIRHAAAEHLRSTCDALSRQAGQAPRSH